MDTISEIRSFFQKIYGEKIQSDFVFYKSDKSVMIASTGNLLLSGFTGHSLCYRKSQNIRDDIFNPMQITEARFQEMYDSMDTLKDLKMFIDVKCKYTTRPLHKYAAELKEEEDYLYALNNGNCIGQVMVTADGIINIFNGEYLIFGFYIEKARGKLKELFDEVDKYFIRNTPEWQMEVYKMLDHNLSKSARK